MIAALLPVKSFTRSKQRLAGFLTPAERAQLARAMFEDVWDILTEAQAMAQGLDRLLVASAEPYVLARCRELGIACLEETEQTSHSDSVKLATDWAMRLGATALLSVPIDTPGITAAEIMALLDLGRRFPVVIVPSADGLGTNALLRTPADAIHPHFGPGSCRLHAQEAETKGWQYLVHPSPGLGSDIDTPEDLQNFASQSASHERPCRTRELIRQLLAADRPKPQHRTAGRGIAACP
jgi:2-phospho-L-lactate guanylyltransferase